MKAIADFVVFYFKSMVYVFMHSFCGNKLQNECRKGAERKQVTTGPDCKYQKILYKYPHMKFVPQAVALS